MGLALALLTVCLLLFVLGCNDLEDFLLLRALVMHDAKR